jgi:putative Mn2+ efflux pump MntP
MTTNSWADLLVLPLAIGLGIDAFSVAMGAGTFPTDSEGRRTFRLVFHFGLFQGGMALLGWLAGHSVAPIVADFDHWIAFLLLTYVGGCVLLSAWRGDANDLRADPSRGSMLVLMSVGTSIDALAVGLSFALAGSRILWPSLTIGLVAAIMTYVGLKVGSKMGVLFGRPTQIIGGLVLMAIGVRVLTTHLLM